ncbi:hypothetical protein [Streptomyces sp. JJ38]|uniref:DUF7848 domain-containing protein n=1 Tax=Streptomyces sp. JJ38 TaxID=2738128 RepID=UPI001C56EF28|nr:hypothetical protein [Streptomyces sp. JJ38]MBW1596534.1 hypothetical protein [Streptomyces sp. JJ38]
MTRAVLRYVRHTIRHEPLGGITFESFCVTPGCGEDSGPQEAQEQAQDWCLRHTGRTGHALFRRIATDHARVTREE